MQNWYHIFPKNTGLSAFAWVVFCLLPFYFIIRSSSLLEVGIGIVLIVCFFTTYRLSFIKKGWTVYFSVSIQMAISIGMTLYFGYVYFSLFLAFFIGNLESKNGFITLYVIHLVSTISAVSLGFYIQSTLFLSQLPFIAITVFGVILLPFTLYNRNKQDKLEHQLEDANRKISQLMVIKERQRIARDLHDTLGQKLSLIGLKSDLAGKLVTIDPQSAKNELQDINQTARTALKEVRDLVSEMKRVKLKEEIIHARQMMDAAQMQLHTDINADFIKTPILVENVLSMCLKEAVTNVVKHSYATDCYINVHQTASAWMMEIKDNGVGNAKMLQDNKGNGLRGIKERLEFVNGNLEITGTKGTVLTIRIPNVIKQSETGEEKVE
ncbi:two-component sensor histidine kinase DesK [Virgibacillus salarius]|uniref:sensor histidine kinase n=1 Tax=Virgibacillus salarius TaxID=447199 RepID=UPI0004064E27|nr:sensor histidine kinase [Priestia megaterium]